MWGSPVIIKHYEVVFHVTFLVELGDNYGRGVSKAKVEGTSRITSLSKFVSNSNTKDTLLEQTLTKEGAGYRQSHNT